MKKWVSEKIPEIVNIAYSAKGFVFGVVSTTGASLQARTNSRRRRRKDLILPEEAEEGLTRRISCEAADGQKWNRRSEPTANLTPAHGRRWGGNREKPIRGWGTLKIRSAENVGAQWTHFSSLCNGSKCRSIWNGPPNRLSSKWTEIFQLQLVNQTEP